MLLSFQRRPWGHALSKAFSMSVVISVSFSLLLRTIFFLLRSITRLAVHAVPYRRGKDDLGVVMDEKGGGSVHYVSFPEVKLEVGECVVFCEETVWVAYNLSTRV